VLLLRCEVESIIGSDGQLSVRREARKNSNSGDRNVEQWSRNDCSRTSQEDGEQVRTCPMKLWMASDFTSGCRAARLPSAIVQHYLINGVEADMRIKVGGGWTRQRATSEGEPPQTQFLGGRLHLTEMGKAILA
jgi:hypothetical protein